MVIDEPVKGYGQACLTGISYLNIETDIVVFLDGDYSDHPSQLPNVVDPIIKEDYDFIIGSRILGNPDRGAMTPQAYWGNKLACFLMKLYWKHQYTDLGPFRAIRYSSLKKLKMQDRDFGWTIEMQIKAVEKKLRIKEVPVKYRKRIGKSKISGTISGTFLAGKKILLRPYLNTNFLEKINEKESSHYWFYLQSYLGFCFLDESRFAFKVLLLGR